MLTLWRYEIERIKVSCSYLGLNQWFTSSRHSTKEVVRSLSVVKVPEIGDGLTRSAWDFDSQIRFAVRKKSMNVYCFAIGRFS